MQSSFLSVAYIVEEWDPDEVMLMLGSVALCIGGLFFWVKWLFAGGGLGHGKPQRGWMILAFIFSFVMMLFVTWFWTAKEIRHGQAYSFLVLAMGGAWLSVCSGLFRILGVSVREDVCERRNEAASLAVSGALIGTTFLYCGANTGEGPSFWNNVFSVLLGGVGWFAIWMALEAATKVSRSITEDRDVASGIRLGGFLVAQGLVLGRALAGNWYSPEATTLDFFRDGWPALLILAGGIAAERALRPTVTNPLRCALQHGVSVVMVYLVTAIAWVLMLGWWEGAPE